MMMMMMMTEMMTISKYLIIRVTIPTSENGDVTTVVVEDGLVFNSGAHVLSYLIRFESFKHTEGEILTWLEAWNDNGQQTCGVR